MFDSIGWIEILIIVVAGLFILGPERLPSAAAWVGKTIRQVREYATGARDQLKQEMGPEFDQLRKPLEDLRELRNFDPKRAITKHLWDDVPTNGNSTKPNGFSAPHTTTPQGPTGARERERERPLQQGERPPYDPDAT
ncbi:Sec-independent protein translocase protein TatB [Actinosynnema sp. NPDC047251]|uniref:Sec-independent protein translocase protein TatB n=1 Tax=Saccharothrix espanaensis (strain ATCC 51144 / DSM 44229 / JCM 9112 / NBRC 15066 / NRRL 15764) TaxID=1179773 RepID=K0JVJ1_SACES|nr:Sec-independent protein translocase protein TatB [Saccharothrix espanaensis]CCH28213.1 putative membrane protein [Saccharothrix espanaensis DSM 44229]